MIQEDSQNNYEIKQNSQDSSMQTTTSQNSCDLMLNEVQKDDETQENIIKQYNQNNVRQLVEYQKKVEKLNRLLEGKRCIAKPNQTGYLPIDALSNNININYSFQIFGHIDIPTNFQYSENALPVLKCVSDSLQCNKNLQNLTMNKLQNRIEIVVSSFRCGTNQFQFVYDFLSKQPSQELQQLANFLEKYQQEVNLIIQKQKVFNKMTSKLYQEIEEDYQSFIQQVKEIINKFDKDSIFKYTIGRMNYLLGDIDINIHGASLEYYKILGLNYDIIQYACLRGRSFNLKCIYQDPFYLTLKQIQSRIENDQESLTAYYTISTLDGFRLDVQICLTKVQSSFTRHLQTPYDHIGYIEQVYIHPNQLEALRQYRQNLALKNNFNSYEQYLDLELSKIFESVEYSVYAELFLDKYYRQSNNQQQP